MKFFKTLERGARVLSKWMSYFAAGLVLILIFLICTDVIARYVFNSPIYWVYEMSYILGATIAAMGIGQLMLDDGNVRVDLFYVKFSEKAKRWVDILFSVFIFIPAYYMLAKALINNCITAFKTGETSVITTWYPLLWPIKAIICIGVVVFLIDYVIIVIGKIVELVQLYRGKEEKA